MPNWDKLSQDKIHLASEESEDACSDLVIHSMREINNMENGLKHTEIWIEK